MLKLIEWAIPWEVWKCLMYFKRGSGCFLNCRNDKKKFSLAAFLVMHIFPYREKFASNNQQNSEIMLTGNIKNCARCAIQHSPEKLFIYFRRENNTHQCFFSCVSTSDRGDRYFMKEESKSFLVIYRLRHYRWLFGIWMMVVGQERKL